MAISLKNGEFVYEHANTGAADPVAISAATASNLATLFGKRQRYDFEWANATERTAQTGMVLYSRGLQKDTKTEYVYDNGAWRIDTPYIEFSAGTQSFNAGDYIGLTGWTVDNTRSTDSTIVTISGNTLTFVRQGLYTISVKTVFTVAGAGAFHVLSTDVAHTDHIAIGGYVGGVAQFTLPYRISADNTPLYLWAYNPTAANIFARAVRIIRVG